MNYFLQDDATLAGLVGTLATDVIKVGIAAELSVAEAGLVVGLVSSAILQAVDDEYQLTNRLIAVLEESQESGEDYVAKKEEQLEGATGAASFIEYVIGSARQVLIRWPPNQVDRLLSPLPRTGL